MKGLQVTPFGFVCGFCGEGISESLRSMHRHMRLHKESVTKEQHAEALQKIYNLQQDIRRDWSLLSVYLLGTTRKGFSCNCIIGFLHRHVAQRHVDTGHCGATSVVEEDLHNAVGGYVVSLRALKFHVNGSNKHTGLRVKRPTNHKTDKSTEETARSTTDDSDMIVLFLRADESSWLNVYYSMIHGYISTNVSGNNFKETMVKSVLQWSQPIQTSDNELLRAQILCSEWLEKHARLRVARTPGNIRAALLVFDSTTTASGTQNTTFAYRMNTSVILREAEKIVRFFLRQTEHNFVSQLLRNECVKDNPDWRVLSRCFCHMLLHEEKTYNKNTPIINYCIARMFRVCGETLTMSGAGKSANICSDVLFLMRTAICCSLYEDDGGGGTEQSHKLINEVRSLRTLNTIAPIIRQLREIDQSKPTSYKSTVCADGNVLVQSLVFRKSVIERLVPTVVEKCSALFEEIFADDTWKLFLDINTPVNVTKESKGDFVFTLGNGVDKVCSSDMSVSISDEVEVHTVTLMGYVDMIFHGFGGGPMRYQELQRMQMTDIVWHGETLYYTCTAKKKFSCLGSGSRVVERKLPRIASRIILLHQHVVRLIGQRSGCFGKPFGVDCVHMQDAISCVFGLRSSPSCLDCRHLWASVSNMVSNENHSVDFLSATEQGSDLCGHSQSTHTNRYASGIEIGKEAFFHKYHRFIGCNEKTTAMFDDNMPEIGGSDLDVAVELLYGPGSTYLSNAQRDLVHTVACSKDHIVARLHCGAGKSLGWMLPILVARTFGRKFGSILVILPYRFLATYHHVSSSEILKANPAITTNTILGRDVGEKELPCFLDVGGRLPDLIFATIDGWSTLARYHEGTIARLAGTGALSRIIVDEVHTVCTELFRALYEQLRQVTRYNIPMLIMSATLTPEMTLGLMSYMGIDKDKCRTIESNDLLGPMGDDFAINISVCGNPTSTTIFTAIKLLKKHEDHSVHIIVATKGMGDTVVSQLREDYTTAILTSATSEIDQRDISKRWKDGGIRVLISTTCGLCGNENRKCHHVIVCGNVYSLINFVQSLGRVRPSQRTEGSTFDVILGTNEEQRTSEYAMDDEQQVGVLVSKGLLRTSHGSAARKVLGKSGALEWILNDSVCRMVALSNFFQQPTAQCKRCDHCRKLLKNERMNATPTLAMVSNEHNNENESLRVINHMIAVCLVCRSSVCDGEKCLPFGACYLCAGRHRKADCQNKVMHVFEGRGCQYCYDLRDRRNYISHEVTECPLQRRLRRCVQDLASKSGNISYQNFVVMNFCETRLFYQFLCQCYRHYAVDKLQQRGSGDGKGPKELTNGSRRNMTKRASKLETTETDTFDSKRHRVDAQQGTISLSNGSGTMATKGAAILAKTGNDSIGMELLHVPTAKGMTMTTNKTDSTFTRKTNPYLKPKNPLHDVTNCLNGSLYMVGDRIDLPLLPPDYYPKGILRNPVDLPKDLPLDELRSLYQYQSVSSRAKRKYVDGALYRNIPQGYYAISPEDYRDIDVTLKYGNSMETEIHIRRIPEDSSIASDIVCLGIQLGRMSGNCRKKSEDVGDMYALGIQNISTQQVYKFMENADVWSLYIRIKKSAARIFGTILPSDCKEIQELSKLCYPSHNDNGGNLDVAMGKSMMLSKNLGNAAHVDSEDLSRTIVVFCEEQPHQSQNWNFIFPNASINGSYGVVVRIIHGLVISWNAKVVSHCTSVTECGTKNNVYGCAFGIFGN